MNVTNQVRFSTQSINRAIGVAGWIYFIHCAELRRLKIGWSENPSERLESLQSAIPAPLTIITARAGSKSDEAALHERFRDLHVCREWFHFKGPLRALVGRILKRSGPTPWPAPVYYTKDEWRLEMAVVNGKANYFREPETIHFRLSRDGVVLQQVITR